MLRNILLIVLVLFVMTIAVVFAALNPGMVTIDLAFADFELNKSLAFILVFGAGAVFGMLCAVLLLLRLLHDRRKLRRALKMAESEVTSLRAIPMQDAN